MLKVELWGRRAGGRSGQAPTALVEEINHLIRRYGNEAVAQVAVLQSQVMPVDEDPSERRG